MLARRSESSTGRAAARCRRKTAGRRSPAKRRSDSLRQNAAGSGLVSSCREGDCRAVRPADKYAADRPISADAAAWRARYRQSVNGLREISTVSCAPQPYSFEVSSRTTMTCCAGSVLAQRARALHRQRDQPQRFARRIEAPARERQHAVVGQVRSGNRRTRRWCKDCSPKARTRRPRWTPRYPPAWLAAPDIFRRCGARRSVRLRRPCALRDGNTGGGSRAANWLAHDGVGDDGIDLHRGDVVAAGGQRARHVVAAARADDQRFRARTQDIGKSGPSCEQLAHARGASDGPRSNARRCAVAASASITMLA